MGERRWIWRWAPLFPLVLAVAFQFGCSKRSLSADAAGTDGPADGAPIDAVDPGDDAASDGLHDAASDGLHDAASDGLHDAASDGLHDADGEAPDSLGGDAAPCRVPGGNCICGGADQRCCGGPSGRSYCLDPGTACGVAPGASVQTCLACGAAGERCCAANTCAAGGCCVFDRCVDVGATCPLDTAATCGSSPATPGSCGACGAADQPCCAVTTDAVRFVCTAPNTRCTELTPAGRCAPCGAAGQASCAGCSCDPGLNCSATSAICQVVPIACDGASCGAGTRCNPWAGRCEPDDSPDPPPGRDVGEPCTDDADCRSKDGVGAMLIPTCLRDPSWKGGYCLAYCNAPAGGFWSSDPLPRSNCPAGSICLPFPQFPSSESFGACAHECRADADCRTADGFYCRRAFGLTGGEPVFSNGYCAPMHCKTRGCAGLQCGC